MNCPYCDYLLFNLRKPVCPECGRSFDVCAFRFEPQAVHFACPACGQEYVGNDQRGLPWPRQFNCVKCNTPVDASLMQVIPQRPDAAGVFGAAGSSPWQKRKWIGLWPAWWRTVKMTMLRPTAFFQAHREESNAEAYRFAVMTSYLGPGIGMVLIGLFWASCSLFVPGTRAGLPLGLLAGCMWIAAMVVPAVIPLLEGVFTGGLIHLALVFLAPNRRSFGHTYRLAQYSLGPMILCAIPLGPDNVGQVWSVVTTVIAVRTVHRVSGWVAVVAVLWPLMLAAGAGIALLVYVTIL